MVTANPIDEVFNQLRTAKRAAFMPFIVAGDPTLQATTALLTSLPARGASLIEVGFPYSDPIADGPTIQAAYTRALERGIRVRAIFESLRAIRSQLAAPLVAMVSYAIVYRHGLDRFIDQALQAGFSGAIVPDLPADEAEPFFERCCAAGLKLIQLITPTTPEHRIEGILARCSGFVYYVSVTGITGERSRLSERIGERIRQIKQHTALPVCVGFGVSSPQQVRELAEVADGVIVGSAIVRRIAERAELPLQELVQAVGDYVEQLSRATMRD